MLRVTCTTDDTRQHRLCSPLHRPTPSARCGPSRALQKSRPIRPIQFAWGVVHDDAIVDRSRASAVRILGAILGAKLPDTPRHWLGHDGTANRKTPARSACVDMSWHTMSWQDVIRDVEAGGSNPLTPTKGSPRSDLI